MILQNLVFFWLLTILIVLLQIVFSYLSVRSFLEGEWVMGGIFFLGVMFSGFLIAFYFTWIRRGKTGG
ncbi:MAG: hypothetical protein NTY64_11900 [Deltaproteobacteria bacterium]|nr:hypothetical protein [Deltaproteobacteria bacterium]